MNNETAQPVEASSSEEARSRVAGIAAKSAPGDILDRLISDLHNLILITISTVYYLDCFSILFLVRFVGQNHSKNGGIRIVLTTNVICILTHIFHSLPQPGPREFWNHGGALVDFVGEKPASRFKVLVLDLLIVTWQMLYLTLYYKKIRIDAASRQSRVPPTQDLEAEEAGISRANPPAQVENGEGIEMQSLLPDGHVQDARGGQTREEQGNTILLRKGDFKEIFVNTTATTNSEESAAAVRRFIGRVNAVRARRAALQAANARNMDAA